MNRRETGYLLLFLLIPLLLLASGCSGGGSSGTETRKNIAAQIDSFKVAVEDYDVGGMLRFLKRDDFYLIIAEQEPGLKYSKPYSVLARELKSEETEQLLWREDQPLGHSYRLELRLGELIFGDVTATRATVTTTFEVYESSAAFSSWLTDTGNMEFVMEKHFDHWVCTEMSIGYSGPSGPASQSINSPIAGFGFGRMSF